MKLEGKVALVTGASRGIGKAVARLFAEEGARLVINSSGSGEALDLVQQEISRLGSQCIAYRADVSQMDQVEAMMAVVEKTYQGLDILVNNAGIIRRGDIQSVTEEEWDEVIRVNLKGTFNCCKAASQIMIQQRGGKIINITSVAGKVGDITSAPGYGPSKAAVNNLTKSLALQLAPYNINVNAIAPHAIETEMSAQWSEEKHKSILETIPLKRLGKPEEVAAAALFLASDDADFITGEILDVNGGYWMD